MWTEVLFPPLLICQLTVQDPNQCDFAQKPTKKTNCWIGMKPFYLLGLLNCLAWNEIIIQSCDVDYLAKPMKSDFMQEYYNFFVYITDLPVMLKLLDF